MTLPRFAYRARQFWNALLKPEIHIPTGAIQPYLTPAELPLFRQMQPSEQRHSYLVFKRLRESGQTEANLLSAALLHDVGKILSPLSILDRVLIVVGRYLFPKASRRWGTGAPKGLRRPFVVAACHGEWGADLVEKAGGPALTVELIRRHHEPPVKEPATRVEELLADLHAVDNEH